MLKEKVVFTGSYEQCQKYVNQAHLQDYKIKRKYSSLRLLFSGGNGDPSIECDRKYQVNQEYKVCVTKE